MNQVTDLLDRLADDLAPTGLRLEAGLFDLRQGRWVAGEASAVPQDFGDDGHVLVLPGRQHLLLEATDGGPDLLTIVDDVQEWAIDELGHGWPELHDDNGRFLVLLQPTNEHGRPVWAGKGHTVDIGRLSAVRVAVPPKWDGSRH